MVTREQRGAWGFWQAENTQPHHSWAVSFLPGSLPFMMIRFRERQSMREVSIGTQSFRFEITALAKAGEAAVTSLQMQLSHGRTDHCQNIVVDLFDS